MCHVEFRLGRLREREDGVLEMGMLLLGWESLAKGASKESIEVPRQQSHVEKVP